MSKKLVLNLDELYEEGYYYTDYDIGSSGHSITIDIDDKEEFLNQFSSIWGERAERLLTEEEDVDE